MNRPTLRSPGPRADDDRPEHREQRDPDRGRGRVQHAVGVGRFAHGCTSSLLENCARELIGRLPTRLPGAPNARYSPDVRKTSETYVDAVTRSPRRPAIDALPFNEHVASAFASEVGPARRTRVLPPRRRTRRAGPARCTYRQRRGGGRCRGVGRRYWPAFHVRRPARGDRRRRTRRARVVHIGSRSPAAFIVARRIRRRSRPGAWRREPAGHRVGAANSSTSGSAVLLSSSSRTESLRRPRRHSVPADMEVLYMELLDAPVRATAR